MNQDETIVAFANSTQFYRRMLASMLAFTVLTVSTGFWMANQTNSPVVPTPGNDQPVPAKITPGSVGGVPLFTGWPKDKPDLAIVVTGQTYGYLRPCGCSEHQLGGLERRANFMNGLRAKGWNVVGVDLGDIVPPKDGKILSDQAMLKYEATMQSLKEMGYVAVGIGEHDFKAELPQLIGRHALQNATSPPVMLAGNLVGVQKPDKVIPLDQLYPAPNPKAPGARPLIESYVVANANNAVPIGVISLVGPSVAKKAIEIDPSINFQPNGVVLKNALAKLAAEPAKPQFTVLMYQGSIEEVKGLANDFPQIQLIICNSDDSEPPQFPQYTNDKKTTIIQVGHKGRYLGTVGVFKTQKGFELQYQLVPLGEEYLTPAADEKTHKILPILESYAGNVMKEDILGKVAKNQKKHPVMIKFPQANVKYVGSEACAKCHAAEYKIWAVAKHAHAYEALEKLSKRPSNRQFDPECIVCHSTGFEYETGFKNLKDSKELVANGCENCHGPGSAHVAKPNDKDLIAAMVPWRLNATDKLPPKDFFEKMGKLNPVERGKVEMGAAQQRHINAVQSMCIKCHDTENDPKFDFYLYFPKIHHSGLKAQGLPPGADK